MKSCACAGMLSDWEHRWRYPREVGPRAGVWRFENGQFVWTPASDGEPLHNAKDAAAAVRYMLVALSII